MSLSTIEELRLALCAVTISPAQLKILSDGTDVAGILSLFLARFDKCGKYTEFVCHHKSGSALKPIWGESLYLLTSSVIISSLVLVPFTSFKTTTSSRMAAKPPFFSVWSAKNIML